MHTDFPLVCIQWIELILGATCCNNLPAPCAINTVYISFISCPYARSNLLTWWLQSRDTASVVNQTPPPPVQNECVYSVNIQAEENTQLLRIGGCKQKLKFPLSCKCNLWRSFSTHCRFKSTSFKWSEWIARQLYIDLCAGIADINHKMPAHWMNGTDWTDRSGLGMLLLEKYRSILVNIGHFVDAQYSLP